MPEPIDRATRRSRALAHVLLTLATVGLGTSALMLYLYLSPEAAACGPGGGCDAVRTSRWSEVAGIPLPYLGMAYFGALTTAVLVPALRRRWLLVALGLGGVATGITLLTLQGAVIGAWCPYCVVVDACSLGAGLALAPGLASPRVSPAGGPVVAAFGLGAAVPLSLAAVLHTPPPPPVPEGPAPEVITGAQAEGRVTIVEFLDFECPFCRRQHARLSGILAQAEAAGREPVTVVHKHLPLRMHPHARGAARVAICAEEQGRGPDVIDALFTHDDLSPEACLEHARQVGVDEAALQECLGSTRPDQRLEADAAAAREAGVSRLPTCFIGGRRFVGIQEESTLREAIDRARAAATAPT